MILLLDPLLTRPDITEEGAISWTHVFWNNVVEWASDQRVRIGVECHQLVYETFAHHGYPERDLDTQGMPLVREYQSALNTLLGRVQPSSTEPAECQFDPLYTGDASYSLALQMDISSTAASDVVGVATSMTSWDSPPEPAVRIVPGPPTTLEACFSPNLELEAEKSQTIHSYYATRRVHFVGGQVDARYMEHLCEILGVDAAQVTWIPSEKSKPPRDLDKTWGSLVPDRDITVCITGRMSHSTWNAARKTTQSRGLIRLDAEHVSDVEGLLLALTSHRQALETDH